VFASAFDKTGDLYVVRLEWFDLDPALILSKDEAFIAQCLDAGELEADVVGGGIGKGTEIKPRVDRIEAVEMALTNERRVGRRIFGSRRDDRFPEGIDIELTVTRPGLPRRNMMKRPACAAEPASTIVPERTNTIDLDRNEPFAGKCLAVPGGWFDDV
jgi:hypothetical protein